MATEQQYRETDGTVLVRGKRVWATAVSDSQGRVVYVYRDVKCRHRGVMKLSNCGKAIAATFQANATEKA